MVMALLPSLPPSLPRRVRFQFTRVAALTLVERHLQQSRVELDLQELAAPVRTQ